MQHLYKHYLIFLSRDAAEKAKRFLLIDKIVHEESIKIREDERAMIELSWEEYATSTNKK